MTRLEYFDIRRRLRLIDCIIMFGYGSSSRGATGKRGHGGREYRRPPERKDPNSSPPPMKECNCLVELDIPEYASPQEEGRRHTSFGGRDAMQKCVKEVRSMFCCHVEIPGRNKCGPIGIVGRNLQSVVPAVHHLIHHSQIQQGVPASTRIHPNVKQSAEILVGNFFRLPDCGMGIFFASRDGLQIGVCKLDSTVNTLENLQICVENLQFKHKDCTFDVYVGPRQHHIFANAKEEHIELLLDAIAKIQ